MLGVCGFGRDRKSGSEFEIAQADAAKSKK